MGIKEKLRQDLKEALKAKDAERKLAIRMLLAALLNEEKAGNQERELSEEEIVAVMAREAKQRRESIEAYTQGGRQDLVDEEQAQLAILQEYLPQQLSEQEIRTAAQEAIAATEAESERDLGQVMRQLMPRMKGKADGRLVNKIVMELLSDNSQG